MRKLLFSFILLVFTIAVAAQPAIRNSGAKPSIIFILADDLGYGDIGCYGQEKIKTPNIDRMAAEGIRFTQFYAGSTVCAPSRAVLMTGLHTGHVSIKGNGDHPLQENEITIAQTLKRSGYATGILGKWGLGTPGTTGTPDKKGFDYFFGYLHHVHAHNHYPGYLWRNAEKVPLQNKLKTLALTYTKEPGGYATEKLEYGNDLFTEEALQFIEGNKAKPFFLYLAYTVPHANNEAERLQEMEVPSDAPYTGEHWPQPQKNKAAMITRLDDYVGRILKKLKDLNLDQNTLVIFTSDNGPHKEGVDPEFFNSNGMFRGIKRDLYEGGIRVPMVAWMPGKIKSGTVSHHTAAFWDVAPTLAALAGQKTSVKTDGISFLPTLLGAGKQQQHKYLFWQFNEGVESYAVRKEAWKLVKLKPKSAPDFSTELYNLQNDPEEKMNLAAQHPDITKQLLQLIEKAQE